jgi:hypothetical protein
MFVHAYLQALTAIIDCQSASNPILQQYKTVLEQDHPEVVPGAPVVNSRVVDSIIGEARSRDPRGPHDNGLENEAEGGPIMDGVGAAVEVPGLEEQEDLNKNHPYFAGETERRDGAVERHDCTAEGHIPATNGKLTVESGLFAVLFERGTAFNIGGMALAVYLAQRVMQLWSPFTLLPEYVLIMYQVRQ